MQVDPVKPKLKAPGTKRLKLDHDTMLSNFAFNSSLRRYAVDFDDLLSAAVVGRCRSTLSSPHLEPLELSA